MTRRTGKQALHLRVREGDVLKRLHSRARSKQIELADDLSECYFKEPLDESQEPPDPSKGDPQCE